VGGVWWALETLDYLGVFPAADGIRPFLLILGFFLAIGVAVYTAFLFAQAEGRDLWQSSLLPFHLIVQAVVMGSAALLIIAVLVNPDLQFIRVNAAIFIVALLVDLFLVLAGEFGIPHATEVAAQAAHDISHGRYRRYFWGGSIAIGHVVPLLLMLAAVLFGGGPLVVILAGLAAIVGMYTYEYAFVMAPQDIPNS
jgi:formate-dependent nitrite reductase membrane component NrfD